MKTIRISAAALFASLLLPLSAAPAEVVRVNRVHAYLSHFATRNDFSGRVVVEQRGKIIFARSYGLANRELVVPNRHDTRYRIGSVSKQFTAAAILVLRDRGKLQLDDVLETFVPGVPNGKSITIHQLLTHSAGVARDFPDKREFSRSHHSTEELLAVARTLPAGSPPGTRFAYSNVGYFLLAAIVEDVARQPLGDFLEANVWNPLRMTSTSFDVHGRIIPFRASGYQTAVGTSLVNAEFEDMANELGYGSVISTAADLLKWRRAWFHSSILSDRSWKEMFTDHGNHQGYGVSIREEEGRKVLGHDGSVAGFNAFVRYFPDEDVTVIYVANIESGLLSIVQSDLAALLFGEMEPELPPTPRAMNVAPEVLARYAGAYQVTPEFVMDVRVREDTLYLRGGEGTEWIALTPTSPTTFFFRHLFATIEFVREGGPTVELIWKSRSGTYRCKKIR